jgi:hypothetical protein
MTVQSVGNRWRRRRSVGVLASMGIGQDGRWGRGAGSLAGVSWPSKVHARGIGLKSENGVEGKNDETGDPRLLDSGHQLGFASANL